MQFAIVITDTSFDLADFIRINQGPFSFQYSGVSEIVYEDTRKKYSHISIKKDNTLYELMEDEEKMIVDNSFESFNMFLFMYFEFENAKQIIGNIPLDKKILIDNDHGCIMNRDSFMKTNSYQEFINTKH
ncbi:hypothetical protein [Chitinophaga sp. GbtcB8]|uniref:hypothetical protein n=1 Tax=Chitinophaga sp. GbtcB8 TaxID=2824753 RepID=UPI001C2F7986|nr:hypothetical protein [Chitinophaga sp. GbtcB8]